MVGHWTAISKVRWFRRASGQCNSTVRGGFRTIWTQYSRQRRGHREDSGDIHTHTYRHSLWVLGRVPQMIPGIMEGVYIRKYTEMKVGYESVVWSILYRFQVQGRTDCCCQEPSEMTVGESYRIGQSAVGRHRKEKSFYSFETVGLSLVSIQVSEY